MSDQEHTYCIAHLKVGSNSMMDTILSEGKILHSTGKAKLIKGKDTAGREVQVWLPNFFIRNTLPYAKRTVFLLHRYRESDLEMKML
jgi:hypothetical protein